MKKIISVGLLLVGIGLIGLATLSLFISVDQEECYRSRSWAEAKLIEAAAAQGTPKVARLLKEAQTASDLADRACRQADHTRLVQTLMGLGGLASIIISVTLLIISRKHRKQAV